MEHQGNVGGSDGALRDAVKCQKLGQEILAAPDGLIIDAVREITNSGQGGAHILSVQLAV